MFSLHIQVTNQIKQINQTIVLSPQLGDHRKIRLRKIRLKTIVLSPQPDDHGLTKQIKEKKIDIDGK